MAANLEAAKKLNLTFSNDFLGKCGVFHGVRSRLGRPAKVAFVTLADGLALDEAQRGVFEGLAAAKLVEGHDVQLTTYNAQGELSQLPQIFDTIQTTGADLIITSTTPAMIAAAQSTETIPIVFTVASEPSAVGVFPAGERQENLVGVYDNPPIAKLLELATRREGPLSAAGTIWNPAEPNSEISVKRLREACRQRGIKLVERNAAATNELRDVTSAICQTNIDILVISADNVTSSGFPAIVAVTQQQGVPIYCTEPDLVSKGAAAAIGVNFYDWGRQSARLAAQVLAGRALPSIPLEEVSSIRQVTSD
jgi:putative ABC transport system substrate-binding protein